MRNIIPDSLDRNSRKDGKRRKTPGISTFRPNRFPRGSGSSRSSSLPLPHLPELQPLRQHGGLEAAMIGEARFAELSLFRSHRGSNRESSPSWRWIPQESGPHRMRLEVRTQVLGLPAARIAPERRVAAGALVWSRRERPTPAVLVSTTAISLRVSALYSTRCSGRSPGGADAEGQRGQQCAAARGRPAGLEERGLRGEWRGERSDRIRQRTISSPANIRANSVSGMKVAKIR